MTRPTIGIFLRRDGNKSYLKNEIFDAVIYSGGFPVAIYCSSLILEEIIFKCDGFIFPGGDDFTDCDITMIERLSKLNKPILGICLGMQAMSSWAGGTLKIIDKGNHLSQKLSVHDIYIEINSKLYKILKETKISVNSRHKYCVENTKLNVSAISDDNIIEAVELSDYPFFLGVQWHPETTIKNDVNSKKIFNYFIKCCRGD